MSPENFDVIIVGAGPAGATAALAILKEAPTLSICLIDRDEFPRDKSCGDGLGPGVRRVLRELDGLEVVADAPSPPAVRVGGPDGWEGYAEGPQVQGKDLSGFVLPRFVFDARLVDLARKRGATVIERTKFVSSKLVDGQRAISVSHDGQTRTLHCKILVGADGAYSRVRRELGVGKALDKDTHIAMRAYAKVNFAGLSSGEAPGLRLDFDEQTLPAYGWVFPTGDGEANVGVGIPLTILKKRQQDLGKLLDDYVAALKLRGIHVESIDRRLSHLLPHAASVPRMAHDRAVLIGDAASTINTLSGEGIYYGMAAGQLLGKSLAAATGENPDDINRALRTFEEEFRKKFRLHFLSCAVGHKFLRSKTWARAVIKASVRDQRVMDDAAFLLFDEQRMKVSTGLRILRHGF
ncbi:NAD(P)/FAD-dependent oxidoreductase [Actinoplanes sp. NPDC020271]|uniref:NAD(P)/FAD-dependent oxidoreductase n=1 Tax=Actinoplanes sp. NPDC020271 TaxID=3363896 RepID=UPI0037A08649